MKDKLYILLDIVMIFIGVVLAPAALILWSKTGFQLAGNYAFLKTGNLNGNTAFCLMMLGIALVAYGLFDYFILRKNRGTSQ